MLQRLRNMFVFFGDDCASKTGLVHISTKQRRSPQSQPQSNQQYLQRESALPRVRGDINKSSCTKQILTKKKKRNRWPGTKGKQQNYPRHLCNRSFFSQHKKSQLVWDTALFHAGSARNKKCISSWRLPLTTTVIQETGHQRIKQHSSEMLASLVSRKPVPQNEWEVGTLQQLE